MYAYVNREMTLPRWIASVPLAILFTVALLQLMVQLVFVEFEELPDEPHKIPPVIHEPKVIETFPSIEPVEKPVLNEAPPIPETGAHEVEGGVSIPVAGIETNLGNQDFSLRFSGMPIAQYLTQPKYPRRAIARGVEGYVDVRFDISKIGTTENVVVLAANPSGYFEKSAINAVLRWRYQPKVEDGEAKPFKNMTHRIRFQMGQ